MSGHGQRSGRRGFTLVEALAVVMLVCIVLPAVMYGISFATGASGLVVQRSEAGEIAANKLTELTLTGDWQTGNLSGDVALDSRSYHWTSQVADWEEPGLYELTVQVSWTSRGQVRNLALSTLVYDGSNAQ